MQIKYLGGKRAKLIVSITTEEGQRVRRSRTVEYKQRKDVPGMWAAFRDEVQTAPAVVVSVSELVDQYISNRQLIGTKPTTIKGYRNCAKTISSRIGKTEAQKLTAYMVNRLIFDLSQTKSPKTIRNTIGLLNAAYNYGIRTGFASENPCTLATLPKYDRPEIDTLSHDEIIRFLAELESEALDYKVGYKLALLCGLRRSEILGLKEEDVSTAFRTIKICRTRHILDGGAESIQTTKTKKSARTLAISETLAADIDALIRTHDAQNPNHSDFLILDSAGNNINPSTFSDRVYAIAHRAGIEHISLHGLRHSFATMLNAEGFDIAQISAELGHSNITTTLNIYTHVFGGTTASSRAIADRIEEATKSAPIEGAKKQKNKI